MISRFLKLLEHVQELKDEEEIKKSLNGDWIDNEMLERLKVYEKLLGVVKEGFALESRHFNN